MSAWTPLPLLTSTNITEGQYKFSDYSNDTTEEISEVYSETYLWFLLGFFPLLFIFGLVGNGIVIWFLSFLIKKNAITTYVLNLAVADSWVLFSLSLSLLFLYLEETNIRITVSRMWSRFFMSCFIYAYVTSLHLLTSISMERCLLVLFPICYRCRRPKHLSVVVCTLIWVMFCLLHIFHICILLTESMQYSAIIYDTVPAVINSINFLVCTPLVLICTVILFKRVYFNLHQHQQETFSTVILYALLFFLVFGIPFSAMLTIHYFFLIDISKLVRLLGLISVPINSSINPLIYFLSGRKRMCQSRESFKVVLQRVFSEKDDCRATGMPLNIQNDNLHLETRSERMELGQAEA